MSQTSVYSGDSNFDEVVNIHEDEEIMNKENNCSFQETDCDEDDDDEDEKNKEDGNDVYVETKENFEEKINNKEDEIKESNCVEKTYENNNVNDETDNHDAVIANNSSHVKTMSSAVSNTQEVKSFDIAVCDTDRRKVIDGQIFSIEVMLIL